MISSLYCGRRKVGEAEKAAGLHAMGEEGTRDICEASIHEML